MVETKKLPFNKVRIPDVRASSRLNPEQEAFFKATVEEFGIIQDPVARPLPDGTYELIAGRTRILELAESGVREADFKIIEADEGTALFMHLAENVARGEVDPVSVARVIDKLLGMELSISDISRKLGRSETWVRRMHHLLELPDRYQVALQERRLTPTHIQIALQMPTPYEVDQALQTALRLGWNTSTLKIFVTNRLEELARAKDRSVEVGEPYKAPPIEAERLIQYKQCLTCGYQVPLENIQTLLVCDDCRDLIRYVINQCGAPKGAIQTVYNALVEYFKAPKTSSAPFPSPKSSLEQ